MGCSSSTTGSDAGSGSDSGAGSDSGGAADAGDVGKQWDDALKDLLDSGIQQAAVAGAASAFCQIVDQNPNYTSNTIFSTGGKAAFASSVRGAYGNSAVLRTFVDGSGYWNAAGETTAPNMIITQTGNSCQTNIGFVNAICFGTGPQYDTNGSYKASDAPNSGGCSESKR